MDLDEYKRKRLACEGRLERNRRDRDAENRMSDVMADVTRSMRAWADEAAEMAFGIPGMAASVGELQDGVILATREEERRHDDRLHVLEAERRHIERDLSSLDEEFALSMRENADTGKASGRDERRIHHVG